MTDFPVIEVSAGLIFRSGKLLITRRPDSGHLAGLWEFPGGKREPGETFEACLHRELAEELGIEVEINSLAREVEHHYPGRHVRIQFFICRWKAREPQHLGCSGTAWVGSDELANYEFPPADAQLLEWLRSETDLWSPMQ